MGKGIEHNRQFSSFAFSPEADRVAVGGTKGELLILKISDHFELSRKIGKTSICLLEWIPLTNCS